MKKFSLIEIVRWIMFIPGAFLFSYIISIFIKAFPEVLERMDLGIVSLSVFIAKIINSCIWGASFSISGLWIAPRRNLIVNTILSTLFAVSCVVICWVSWFQTADWWDFASVVIFNAFGVMGSVFGGIIYVKENGNN